MDLRQTGRDPLATPIEAGPLEGRSRSWSLPRLACIAAAAFVLAATSTGYLHQRDLARQAIEHSQRLQEAYDDLDARSAGMMAALQAEIAGLEASDAERARTIEALIEIKDEMALRLAAGEGRLRALAAERDRAVDAVQDLEEALETGDLRLESAIQDRASLADDLALAEARLIEVSDQRDASQRSEAGLRWRLASIQTQLESLGARQAQAQSWLEGWVLGNLETLEELVAGTGVDVETLVARAAHAEFGQGGPYEAMVEQAPEEVPHADAVTDHLMRLSALQKLASSLPLAAPLDQFEVTSLFGKRQDPFAQRLGVSQRPRPRRATRLEGAGDRAGHGPGRRSDGTLRQHGRDRPRHGRGHPLRPSQVGRGRGRRAGRVPPGHRRDRQHGPQHLAASALRGRGRWRAA